MFGLGSSSSTHASRYAIEPVETGDIRPVMRLAWRATSHLYPAVFFEEIARRQREYFRVVRDPRTEQVVGFIIAAKQPGRQQNFMLLVVEPTLIGQGLRRALLHNVQEILRAEGVKGFTVEVPVSDKATLDLYRNEGFEVVGVEQSMPPQVDDRALLGKVL